MNNLFEAQSPRPLADRLRPQNLTDVVGQNHLLGENNGVIGPLKQMLDGTVLFSFILWGPPGSGKTTIARLFANQKELIFHSISAVFSGVADLKKIFETAKMNYGSGRATLLFVDEIHRFNKSQQDGFLPYMEDGTIILVGATTENPSFELNPALISRCQILVLNRLDDDSLEDLLKRAEYEMKMKLPLKFEARATLRSMADGDGRYLLNLAEILFHNIDCGDLNNEDMTKVIQRRMPIYDKNKDSHYNFASAFHKSLRGSDADAALYWFERMILGGEDPKFIARRLLRFAIEDIGLADPQALQQALLAWEAFERLGPPEGELALVQAVIYLASAPKSNSSYIAEKLAKSEAQKTGSLQPPKHILNAPTVMMKNMGYGVGYKYDHDSENNFSGLNYFPVGMDRERFYKPGSFGFEKEISKRIAHWDQLRIQKSKNNK